MSWLSAFLSIVQDWHHVFPQPRTFQRGVRQALGSLVCLGRRCLSRIIWTNGGQNRSWSAEYFLHSRCQGDPQQLFVPVFRRALPHCPGRLVGVAVDDTQLRKTGQAISQLSISAIRFPPSSMSIWCWACASCKPPCWYRCIAPPRWARWLCRFAS